MNRKASHYLVMAAYGLGRALAWTLLVAVLSSPATAADKDHDPLLRDVLEMLRAGVSEPVIEEWLAGAERRPRRPTASELVALKKAGASEPLLQRLLELTREGEEPDHGLQAKPQEGPAVVLRKRPTTDPATAVPVPKLPPAAAGVTVEFEVSYIANFDPDEAEWDLYVYLDGEPLVYVPASSGGNPLIAAGKPLRFTRRLLPGSYLLRVSQERHQKRKNGWTHHTRVADDVLSLSIESAEPAAVKIEFRQRSQLLGGTPDPLSFTVRQGEVVRATRERGGEPEDWRLLCEDIEANAGKDGKLRAADRRRRATCVRWADLWQERQVPSRAQVLRRMQRFDYRPVPRNVISD